MGNFKIDGNKDGKRVVVSVVEFCWLKRVYRGG